jgi:aminoglycoside/choline kinase family phosphotransferase
MPDKRAEEMRAFLAAAGWSGATLAPLPSDASTRRYVRLNLNGRKAMLMDQPQKAEAPTAPAHATPEERRALGYNAVARLAGADVERFTATSDFLRARGLSAPEIYASDRRAGFAVIEDLGDDLYADVIPKGEDERALYRAAMEVLAKLHLEQAPSSLPGDKPLHSYDETALLAETDLLTEWFMPVAIGHNPGADEAAEHRALWMQVLEPILRHPPVFVHRDYHAQNLLWLPERSGVARVGLIDFQDGVAGSTAYDIISVLEDARRDVSPELMAEATRHYLDTMALQGRPVDEAQFRAAMAVMAAQRNAKIAGIFARLYKRDGKPRYLAYLPRVWGYLNRDLNHPALAPLKAWYDKHVPMEARGEPRVSA